MTTSRAPRGRGGRPGRLGLFPHLRPARLPPLLPLGKGGPLGRPQPFDALELRPRGAEQAAQAAGEGLWRMPLHSAYRKGLKSLLADLKNTGPRPGGSITAALFLKEFVAKDTAWAHIDIAGPVWNEKAGGATGFGVRTLAAYAEAQAA